MDDVDTRAADVPAAPAGALARPEEIFVERWNLQHRLQHLALAVSMVGLLTTGLSIKYAYTGWAPRVIALLGGFRSTLVLHKASAVLLILVALYHLGFLLYHWRRGQVTWSMRPTRKDALDAVHHALYLLGLRRDPPRFDRYSYLEKFEYLAIFWGMVVMGLSGLALWFPEVAGRLAGRWVLDALRVVHSNEAFVALLSLAFGHFFMAHFHPAVFPSSPVWYSGRISLAHLAEEHPLELERLAEAGRLPSGWVEALGRPAGDPCHRLRGWRRALGVVELVIYSAIFYYLLLTFIPMLLA
ncbi:formate dehydrogenase subunit gamma [Caldinitratiruptor microaerophilus]|uniref:Cytochrome b561 bacterial/Ni-hydrogenase domain-containing protein n=1 Tax=Caldinitratiruptor microaerophilus TaxID=671077 RepID=A0AA35CMU2_9FIRM|nr:cytochrome b/b6 domain-containing protein [Caldinitratiruptor microaerophilus]BDG62032.1 hypothetical protein caldi_31220 [Caldinitratiruptor microaerophilus]